MALNYIFIGFFLIGFLVALFRVLAYYLHDTLAASFDIVYNVTAADRDVFKAIVDSTFHQAGASVKYAIVLIGIMVLWLGIMKIGENGGVVNALSRLVGPFFKKLFPEVPKDHPAIGSMLMNICANMLGLDNAATPFGLKAMEDLQTINPHKEKASNAQIMFIVLNTSGLTLIPISIMGYRFAAGAQDPTDVFIPILLTTFCSTIVGLLAVSIVQRINLFNRIIMTYIGSISFLLALIIFGLSRLENAQISVLTSFASNFIIFSLIILFIIMALRKKVNIYESFIDGAKDGFNVAIKIIPYLVAMLVAIGVLRASGTLDFMTAGIGKFFAMFGINTDFVDALPTAFMKPLSGSGARGMMLETFDNFGVDHFASKLSSTFQGSTETTFFTIAVYFGAVGIKNTRHAVTCGLIADLAAIIAGIFFGYLFFH